MAKTELSKPIDYDSLIDDLISKIDDEKYLFNSYTEFRFSFKSSFFLIMVMFFVLAIVIALPNIVTSFTEGITLLLAIFAITVSSLSFVGRDLKDTVVKDNFNKAIKKFKIEKKDEEKRLLLMALLKMKAMNDDSRLELVKKLNKDLFTKEKLLEKLYE